MDKIVQKLEDLFYNYLVEYIGMFFILFGGFTYGLIGLENGILFFGLGVQYCLSMEFAEWLEKNYLDLNKG